MRSLWDNVLRAVIGLLLASSAEAARLTDWSSPQSPFSFNVECESGEVLLIQRSTNLIDWTTFQRSGAGSSNRFIQVPPSFNSSPRNFFRALRTNESLFAAAIAVGRGIDLNGNNLYADSFDSSNPAYSTNQRWDINKRRDHGDVLCNDSISNVVAYGNLEIWGSVAIGPNNPIGPQASVGTAAWHTAGNYGIQPGHLITTNVSFSDVLLPEGSDSWVSPPGSGAVPSGDYRVLATITNSVNVAPNARVRLRVDGGWNFAGNDWLSIGSNATIEVYLNCATADMTGNGIINLQGTANQCRIFGTAVLQSLDMGGNGETTCTVYAPHTDIILHGGGSSDQDFSGAVVANTIKFTGHYTFHFDEGLARTGPRN